MLALVERYFESIGHARTDGDIIELLGQISDACGFRSAYMVEYGDDLSTARHVLDSDFSRRGWWQEYVSQGIRSSTDQISEMFSREGVQVFDSRRFVDPFDPLFAFCKKYDMVECTLVPVSHGGLVIGVGGFCGKVSLTPQQEMGLQLLVYAIFSQIRTFRNIGVVMQTYPLTPREKEVMALSAQGMTSLEIALKLGMSARTVNQHADNVADKLGTKNRAHTVAEVIRRNLLN